MVENLESSESKTFTLFVTKPHLISAATIVLPLVYSALEHEIRIASNYIVTCFRKECCSGTPTSCRTLELELAGK